MTKSLLRVFCWLTFLSAGLFSCETVDIDPVVSISLDSISNNRVSENAGKAYLTLTLNGASKKDVTVSFTTAGTALKGTDYSLTESLIRIPAGKTTGSVIITTSEDDLVEGDETVLISFTSASNATFADANSITLTISDDDSDTDGDGVADAADGCPLDSGSVANGGCPPGFGLVINEVLYDPSSTGLTGDANGDGATDKYEDGFIEFYNNTNVAQNLSGYTLSDVDVATQTATVRYTFPEGTILPGKKAMIIFGGGTPTGTFGGAVVLTVGNPAGLSMNNSGEKIELADPLGNVILSFDSDALSNNPDESYTRNPDLTGDFVQHGSVTPGKLFSPGSKTDGTSF
ncbi:MAG TPA: lamin tail domain-containing protein [Catalimonadaceae bacterium]|nr:lamin tail domain-containing protein [Catalimonadaceae bacterium]HPI11835.1 lamin tail domain-containing protein [Catalimonadaceae bacterium]